MISSSYIKLWKEEFIIFRCVCWCWKLTSCSIYPKKIACLSHLQLKNSEGCSTANLIAIGHIHGLEEAWLLVLVGHPHHPPSIGSSCKSKPKWISPPHAKSTKLTHDVFCVNNLSPTNCTYSSTGISSLPRFKKEMRLANSFVASFIHSFLCFTIHGKIITPN